MFSHPHRLLALWLCLLVPTLAAHQPASAPAPVPVTKADPAPGLTPAQTTAIDALFTSFDHDGSPGYAIGVIKDGRLVYARGYGRANLDYNEPITPKTAFHLSSLSMQFTGAAIALLILDGKLSLETPLTEFIPGVAHFQADLRLKHLIYHTSGLPDYMTLPRPGGWSWFSFHYFTTPEAVATSLHAPQLRFAPGTRWESANVNYMLLALIVEQVSGLHFADFMELRVFAPLGMTQSHINDDTTLIVPGRATGYVARSDPTIRRELARVGIRIREGPGYAQMPRVSPHFGDSGVFSSIEDLAKWDADFTTHQLAGPNFSAQMLQRIRFAHDKDNEAFGVAFGEFLGRDIIWAAGGDLDSSVFMARVPSENVSVICLSNIAQGRADIKGRQVLDLVLPPAPVASHKKK